MNKATPHQHGHETAAQAGHGSHKEFGKTSAEHRGHDQHAGCNCDDARMPPNWMQRARYGISCLILREVAGR